MSKKALITGITGQGGSYLAAYRGDATKTRKELGWQAEYTFAALVSEMVQADLAAAENPMGASHLGQDQIVRTEAPVVSWF